MSASTGNLIVGRVIPYYHDDHEGGELYSEFSRDEQHRMHLRGLPVYFEHQDGEDGRKNILVGVVLSDYVSVTGKVVLIYIENTTTGDTVMADVMYGGLQALSLGHHYDNVTTEGADKYLNEISIVAQPGRVGTDILYALPCEDTLNCVMVTGGTEWIARYMQNFFPETTIEVGNDYMEFVMAKIQNQRSEVLARFPESFEPLPPAARVVLVPQSYSIKASAALMSAATNENVSDTPPEAPAQEHAEPASTEPQPPNKDAAATSNDLERSASATSLAPPSPLPAAGMDKREDAPRDAATTPDGFVQFPKSKFDEMMEELNKTRTRLVEEHEARKKFENGFKENEERKKKMRQDGEEKLKVLLRMYADAAHKLNTPPEEIQAVYDDVYEKWNSDRPERALKFAESMKTQTVKASEITFKQQKEQAQRQYEAALAEKQIDESLKHVNSFWRTKQAIEAVPPPPRMQEHPSPAAESAPKWRAPQYTPPAATEMMQHAPPAKEEVTTPVIAKDFLPATQAPKFESWADSESYNARAHYDELKKVLGREPLFNEVSAGVKYNISGEVKANANGKREYVAKPAYMHTEGPKPKVMAKTFAPDFYKYLDEAMKTFTPDSYAPVMKMGEPPQR